MKLHRPTASLGRAPRAFDLPATLFFLLAAIVVLAISFWQVSDAQAAGEIKVEIVAGYNLVVDSNVSSPSTYAPSVATVMGRFCNQTGTTVNGVQAFIGDYVDGTNDTPGIYPKRTVDSAFTAIHTALTNAPGSTYSFTHVGGRLGIKDATRYIGTMAPGECRVQYWHFSYPQCENTTSGAADLPPCNTGDDPVWGDSVKPGDDLYLYFDMWAKGDGGVTGTPETWKMTMRNEISAMANKIEPNPDGYWFNFKGSPIQPGDVITSNGILYEFGRINQGFDNDGNYTPDYNAWAQPIGDASYDPSCFRLIRATGVLTVNLGTGIPDMIIPFTDQLYFTDLPDNNTGVRGNVRYTFLAMNGPCSTSLSPYQEVASGYDNEKFNGDFGVAIPPIGSYSPEVTIAKTGTLDAGTMTISYEIPFQNLSSTTAAGMTLNSGFGVNMPVVISDTVPNGLNYVGGSAHAHLSYSPSSGATILYSYDSGKTWSTADPGTRLSTWPTSKVIIQWWLNDPLPKSSPLSYAHYQASVPSSYSSPMVENCADGSFGAGVPFQRACATTLIPGSGEIGNRVWMDQNRNAIQDSGEMTQINNVTLSLYWDKNGNGQLDAGDVLITTQNSASTAKDDDDETNAAYTNYNFTNLPDASYLVKIDKLDPDIDTVAQGYTLTTAEVFAVTLSSSTSRNYNTADFGFGPTLAIDKYLLSKTPAYEGENVTFKIRLDNMLPGDGTASGSCQYTVWATIDHPDHTQYPPGGQNTNARWQSTTQALYAPNDKFATTVMNDNSDLLGLSGFNMVAQPANIKRVEFIAYVKETVDLKTDDAFIVRVWDTPGGTGNGAQLGSDYRYAGTYFSSPVGTVHVIRQDITGLRTGGWTWSHFANNVTEMQVVGNKAGGTSGDLALDAAGYIITTYDNTCGGADSTIDPLPLSDSWDANLLEFVSADPPQTSLSLTDPPNKIGTLTWANLGPLYAGGSKTITLVFKALDPGSSTSVQNTANVVNAKFASGRLANNPTDHDSVTINPLGSISGYVWSDVGSTSGWSGATGYDSGDSYLPGLTVNLYGCFDTSTTPHTLITVPDTTKTCVQQKNNKGAWELVSTQTTDTSGYYKFDYLYDGYYYVQVGPPTGGTQSAEPLPNGTGQTCSGACNNIWEPNATPAGQYASATLNVTNFNPINGNENITNVNFGYSNVPMRIYGTVYQDNNGDADRDTGENAFSPGVTVRLCSDVSCTTVIATTTTDTNGAYSFSPAIAGSYYVVVTQPSNTTQTEDPDIGSGVCGASCDNMTTTAVSVVAGSIKGPYDFGYKPAGTLSIGDTLYVDWDGNGTQGDGNPINGDEGEEGIAGVTVYLYEDANGNGTVDTTTDALIATTETATDGTYGFTGLPNGSYIVKVDTTDAQYPVTSKETADPDEANVCIVCDSKGSTTLSGSSDLTIDFGYQPRGFASIGDTVWSDSDADGVLDAGEPGVAGVVVKLYQDQDGDGVLDAEDALVGARTTLGYNVIDGYIDVSGNGVIDSGGTTDDYTGLMGVNVIDGGLDINGDGMIDAADDGVFVGYTVIDGRLDMNSSGTVTTADDGGLLGRYQFTNLAAGNYIVQIDSANLNVGQPLFNNLMTTTGPGYNITQLSFKVALGATDRFWSADFGFTASAIGDTVWMDNNGNGLLDAGEKGIANVSVELWLDTDNDGSGDTQWGETITTDSNGRYFFGGLAGGDYVVKLSASNFEPDGVLDPAKFTPTYDPDAYDVPCQGTDATGCDGQSTLVNTSPTQYGLPLGQVDYSNDFGYQPLALIGDTVWINSNGNTTQDPGEVGIPAITVTLWDCGANDICENGSGDDQLKQTTETDAYGTYSFANMVDGHYQVIVDTADADWPSDVSTSCNYDPDASKDGRTEAIVSGGQVTSLGGTSCTSCSTNADFGYPLDGNGSITGHIFFDPNRNGDIDDGAYIGYEGVPVYLWDSDGNLIASTVTDENGEYGFSGLATGVGYTVSYDSDAACLAGTQPSTGINSEYIIPEGGGGTVDFGVDYAMDFGDLPSNYRITLLGDNGARHIVPSSGAVYLGTAAPDTEESGQPSADASLDGTDETPGSGSGGVVRTPNVSWAPGTNGGSIDVTVGGCPGTCYFSGWIDWNRDGDVNDTGERILTGRAVTNGTQTLTFNVPTGTVFSNVTFFARFRLYATYESVVTTPTGEAANGEVEDYGWYWSPTAVFLVRFEAAAKPSAVLLIWETATEIDNLGFNLYRADSPEDQPVQINSELIPSQGLGSIAGYVYSYADSTAAPGVTYYYWLDDIDIHGMATRHGPVPGTVAPAGSFHIYLPLTYR